MEAYELAYDSDLKGDSPAEFRRRREIYAHDKYEKRVEMALRKSFEGAKGRAAIRKMEFEL